MRPYGPNGEICCYVCLNSTPEIKAAAARTFKRLMDEAEKASLIGTAIYGSPNGPEPLLPRSKFKGDVLKKEK